MIYHHVFSTLLRDIPLGRSGKIEFEGDTSASGLS
jgi:hypothetical protein